MSKSFREDLTGQRFGRLTVIEFVPTENRRTYWKCICDCRNVTTVWQAHLKRGGTTSCGCFQKEEATLRRTTHGESKHRLYRIWYHMKERCNAIKNDNYKYYGGRGIKVCSEWEKDYMVFRAWALKNGYSDGLSIDRIDVNGDYTPENCRWVTMQKQAANKRNIIKVECLGEKVTLRQASQRLNIKLTVLKNRYYKGERGERLFRPVRESKKENN